MYVERPSLTQKGRHVRVWIAPQGLRYEYAPSLEGFLVSETVTINTGRAKRNVRVPSTVKRDFDTVAVIYSNQDHSVIGQLSARLSADTRSVLLALAQSNSPFDMIWAYGTGRPNDLNDYDKVEVFHRARANVYTHEATGGFIGSTENVTERIEFFVDDYNEYSMPEVVKTTNTGGRVTDVKIVDFNMCVQCMESAGCCEYYPVIVATVVYELAPGVEALYLLASHDGGDTWNQNQLAVGLFYEPKIIVQGTRVIIAPDSDIAGEFYYIDGKYLLSSMQSASVTVYQDNVDSIIGGATTKFGDTILIARNGLTFLIKAGHSPEAIQLFTDFLSSDVAVNDADVFLLGKTQNIMWLYGERSALIKTTTTYNKLWVGHDLSIFAKDASGDISWYKPGKGSWHLVDMAINDMVVSDGVTYVVSDIGLYVSHDALNSSKLLDNGQYLYVDSRKKGRMLAYATDSDIYVALGTIEDMMSCPYDKFEYVVDEAQVHTDFVCDNGDLKLVMTTSHEQSPGASVTYTYTIDGPGGTNIISGDPDSYAELTIPIPSVVSGGATYTIASYVNFTPGGTLSASAVQVVPCNVVNCGGNTCIECYNRVPLITDVCC